MTDPTVEKLFKKIGKAKTPYGVLGLKRNCTQKEIKKAFYELSKIIHPDKCKLDGATECFQRASAAYDLLKDHEKRQKYDAGHYEEWMYHSKSTSNKINTSPIIVNNPIPYIIAFEDDISPEEILSILGGDAQKVRDTFKNRKFFSGKMTKEENKDDNDNFDDELNDDNEIDDSKKKKNYIINRFYQSICFLIPIGISFYFAFKGLI